MRSLTLAVVGLFLAAGAIPSGASEPTITSGPVEPSPWPQASDAVVLYDQMNNPGGNATASQNFEAANDAFDCFLADDFIVPAGPDWLVDLVEVDGVYFNGPGPAASVNVWFYTNTAANLPGAPVFTQLNSPYSGGPGPGDFVIALSPAACLPPGAYWLVIQPNMDFTPNGQWGWTDRLVLSNNDAAWQNPGGGFGVCPTWGRRGATCGIDPNAPDQVFRLSGNLGCGGNPCVYPPEGLDIFDSWATIIVELFNPAVTMNLMVMGPTTIQRRQPMLQGGVYVIDTEMVALDLRGISCLGPLLVRESPTRASTGQVRQTTPQICYPADSFFDIFLEVDVNGMTLHNDDPIRMEAMNGINSIPPYDDEYRSPFGMIILFNQNGQPVGRILDVSHIPHPPRDCFFTDVVIDSDFGQLTGQGPVDVLRDAPLWDGQQWVTHTEMLAMDIRGSGPNGPFRVRESPSFPSLGRIMAPGFDIPPAAQSFFDIFVEIDLPALGAMVCNQQPFVMQGTINSLPPTPGDTFQLQNPPILMVDCATGEPRGQIFRVTHRTGEPFDWSVPPPGRDCFCSTARVVVDFGQGPVTIDNLFGPTDINRGPAVQQPDGRYVIQTEMLSLELHSSSTPIGPVDINLSPSRPTMGAIIQQHPGPGPLFPSDSFFDVFVEINTQMGPPLHNEQPIQMSAVITSVPPDEPYQGFNPVPLVDPQGIQRGVLLQEIHDPGDPFDWDPQRCPIQLACKPENVGIEEPGSAPAIAAVHLYPGLPNPFSGSTSLAFDVKAGGPTLLRVYDIAGRLVRTLVDGALPAQTHHEVSWDGNDGDGRSVSAGIYFVRLETEGVTLTRKVILLR